MVDVEPDWPAPDGVRAVTTTRKSGNLATHVGDNPVAVKKNRENLQNRLGLPHDPWWLNQVHKTAVVELPAESQIAEADGSWTSMRGVVCAVLTADCMPIIVTNRLGDRIAAIHAGWRGLAAGIIEQGVSKFQNDGDELMVWLGPSIGQHSYEIGDEVREIFCRHSEEAEEMFVPSDGGRWLASMTGLARQQLQQLGIYSVYGGEWDTFTDSERFFSYRRDENTGRLATLIWLE
ncbi:MAG: peptidoglycan editing factor PgeF [Gammaproteobacteria bacterium]|uniref:Purine nucleoside phosphorylase n=1 Tax=Candidatus Thiopontia autotrophica TaxID=2841688 RepID=A0A8J6TMS9_9GAMM|nr:peptidoglycan editing factor PgeF [Candidatus Thiopontia autotrophica]